MKRGILLAAAAFGAQPVLVRTGFGERAQGDLAQQAAGLPEVRCVADLAEAARVIVATA